MPEDARFLSPGWIVLQVKGVGEVVGSVIPLRGQALWSLLDILLGLYTPQVLCHPPKSVQNRELRPQSLWAKNRPAPTKLTFCPDGDQLDPFAGDEVQGFVHIVDFVHSHLAPLWLR